MISQMRHGIYLPGNGLPPLRVLSSEEHGEWVCQCPKYGITARSKKGREAALLGIKALIRGPLSEFLR